MPRSLCSLPFALLLAACAGAAGDSGGKDDTDPQGGTAELFSCYDAAEGVCIETNIAANVEGCAAEGKTPGGGCPAEGALGTCETQREDNPIVFNYVYYEAYDSHTGVSAEQDCIDGGYTWVPA